MKLKKNLIIITYSHPESHGALLSAIISISKYFSIVNVIYKNNNKISYLFPKNIFLHKDSNSIIEESVFFKKSKIYKLLHFFKFTYKIHRVAKKNTFDIILIFDPIALSSFYIYSIFYKTRKKIVWYHNYDPIYDKKNFNLFSITFLSYYLNKFAFTNLDLFSLPMVERLRFFPIKKINNKFKIIPNFSSKTLHTGLYKNISEDVINIVFVGSIGEGRGIEMLISILDSTINGKRINLFLKGYINNEYKLSLIKYANELLVSENLIFEEFGPWTDVPKLLRNCDIGIAYYDRNSLMTSTLGFGGSTKIFQYIGEGLPVLVDNFFYDTYLSSYNWAIKTNFTRNSLIDSITYINNNYLYLSKSAISDFNNNLNSEYIFDEIINNLKI